MSMNHACLCIGVIVLLAQSGSAIAAESTACPACAEWNLPQEPFRIHGDSYYVGTQGLSSVLITSDDGHVLIDGGLPESAPLIAANIETLGFRIEDVKVILNSHAHFDHSGGIAALQRVSGATVAVSAWSAQAMRDGTTPLGDPQYGMGLSVEPASDIRIIDDEEQLTVGSISLTAYLTPGHTPGGTSWSWQSCEGGECLGIVYADSLSPVSADVFYFTRSEAYPNALADFEMSYERLENLPCDILVSPHPGFTGMFEALERRQTGADTDSFVDPEACKNYVGTMRDWLARRVVEENAQ